jgi:hypothetical protein
MLSRGNHRSRRNHEIDHRKEGNGARRRDHRDEGHEKGRRWRTSRERCARQGQVGEEGVPEKESAPERTKRSPEGSKTATILEMLKRPGGASAKDLLKATGWQPYSLRGFLSGTVGKKMGLTVTSTKGEDGERSYSVKA